MSEFPRFKRHGKTYFWDARLRQLRNVDDPHDFLDVHSWGINPAGDLVVYIPPAFSRTFTKA